MTNVLIAVPTNDRKNYCRDEFRAGLDWLIDVTSEEYDVDVIFTDDTVAHDEVKDYWTNSGFNVIKLKDPSGMSDVNEYRVRSRNALREYFLENKEFTHIFWLDADIIPSDDIINGLIEHEVHSVSGVYYTQVQGRVMPLVYGHVKQGVDIKKITPDDCIPSCHLSFPELIPSRLLHVVCAPFGNTLMTRKIMEDVPFRWYGLGDESVVWFYDAIKKDYMIFVDTHYQSKHIWETI